MSKIKVSKVMPKNKNLEEIGPVEIVSGRGCAGNFGASYGSYKNAYRRLKEKAILEGATFVLILNSYKAESTKKCRDNRYFIEGILYK
jgi:hypothetical protein